MEKKFNGEKNKEFDINKTFYVDMKLCLMLYLLSIKFFLFYIIKYYVSIYFPDSIWILKKNLSVINFRFLRELNFHWIYVFKPFYFTWKNHWANKWKTHLNLPINCNLIEMSIEVPLKFGILCLIYLCRLVCFPNKNFPFYAQTSYTQT